MMLKSCRDVDYLLLLILVFTGVKLTVFKFKEEINYEDVN
jgi:predicted tellurium resistance membrane protein TerC